MARGGGAGGESPATPRDERRRERRRRLSEQQWGGWGSPAGDWETDSAGGWSSLASFGVKPGTSVGGGSVTTRITIGPGSRRSSVDGGSVSASMRGWAAATGAAIDAAMDAANFESYNFEAAPDVAPPNGRGNGQSGDGVGSGGREDGMPRAVAALAARAVAIKSGEGSAGAGGFFVLPDPPTWERSPGSPPPTSPGGTGALPPMPPSASPAEEVDVNDLTDAFGEMQAFKVDPAAGLSLGAPVLIKASDLRKSADRRAATSRRPPPSPRHREAA